MFIADGAILEAAVTGGLVAHVAVRHAVVAIVMVARRAPPAVIAVSGVATVEAR